jgi:anti-sigma regulatory factor (Ser/Thr protein kinase)
VEVADASQVGEARRLVTALARAAGFGEDDAGRAALVATEAATNLARHGGGGALVARALPADAHGARGLELLALDRGPGIPDPARALVDGYSTGGTAGEGLGAMRRQSDAFDLYGAPGQGTALLLRLRPGRAAAAPDERDFGAVCLPLPGERECGDAWAHFGTPSGGDERLVVVDGLGHGPMAADAAGAALDAAGRLFADRPQAAPADAMQAMHLALRATRGAAVAVVALDRPAGRLRFAGVGNIAGSVVPAEAGARSQSTVSHNGTVGHAMRKVQEFEYAWPPGALLVLHSDGLATQWRVDDRPGLAARDAALVAGVLYRDWTRGRDDVTVVVTRRAPSPAA